MKMGLFKASSNAAAYRFRVILEIHGEDGLGVTEFSDPVVDHLALPENPIPGNRSPAQRKYPLAAKFADLTAMPELMEYYPPIDLRNRRLRELDRQLGPVWVRVSGTWSTKTYYDFSGVTGGKAPGGYARDRDILYSWVQTNYPNRLLVGPCTTGDPTTVTEFPSG